MLYLCCLKLRCFRNRIQVRSTFVRLLFVLLSTMTSVAAGATAYSDADSEMAALTMTAIEIEYVNQFRKMCSEEIPSLRPNFGKAILSWRIANEIEVQAVQSFRNQPDSRRIFDGVVKNGVNRSKASLTVLSTEERRKACLGFLALAKEQNQKIRDRTPK